jgi:hypothetical protein
MTRTSSLMTRSRLFCLPAVAVLFAGCATTPSLPPPVAASSDPLLDPTLPPLDNDDPFAGCTVTARQGGGSLVTCGPVMASVQPVAPGPVEVYETAALSGIGLALKEGQIVSEPGSVQVGDRTVPGKRFGVFAKRGFVFEGHLARIGSKGPFLLCGAPASDKVWNRCRGLLGALAASAPAAGVHPLRVLGHEVPLEQRCLLRARDALVCADAGELQWEASSPASAEAIESGAAGYDDVYRRNGYVVDRTPTTDCLLAGAPARCVRRVILKEGKPVQSMLSVRSAPRSITCIGARAASPHPLCGGLVADTPPSGATP